MGSRPASRKNRQDDTDLIPGVTIHYLALLK